MLRHFGLEGGLTPRQKETAPQRLNGAAPKQGEQGIDERVRFDERAVQINAQRRRKRVIQRGAAYQKLVCLIHGSGASVSLSAVTIAETAYQKLPPVLFSIR